MAEASSSGKHTASAFEEAVDACFGHYRAEAVKRGRNPAYPYVPVYRFGSNAGNAQTTQVRGKAYATRQEAIIAAERYIARLKQHMREQLGKPASRALRQQWGLPSELQNAALSTALGEDQ